MAFTKPFLENDDVTQLYSTNDYLTAYTIHTDRRVVNDPHEAVGGLWEELGKLQFDYLRAKGLHPGNSLLDIGCGTLRGGRFFIAYLEKGNYTGIDISTKALEYAIELIEREHLAEKAPSLILDADKRLGFEEFDGRKFDFILAQSVFTHLLEAYIQECFANLVKVMHAGSRFYFTFDNSPQPIRRTTKDFSYPYAFFEKTARDNRFLIELLSDYPHPRKQSMAVAYLP